MAIGFWLAFLGMTFALIKYIYKKNVESKLQDLTPVVNAVINHSKDTVSQIKPAINAYVEKHQSTKVQYCIHCGSKCEDDAAFCVACGKTIEELR